MPDAWSPRKLSDRAPKMRPLASTTRALRFMHHARHHQRQLLHELLQGSQRVPIVRAVDTRWPSLMPT